MQNEPLLVNIGAGLSCGKSWLNFDSSLTLRISKFPLLGRVLNKLLRLPCWPAAVCYGDIVKGLPIKNDSCQLVFSSHAFEHLSFSDFERALGNVYKYLKSGGVFRVIVPDLEAYARNYLKQLEGDGDKSSAASDFLRASGLGCEKTRVVFGSRFAEALANSRHQWLWDRHSLIKKLQEHEFTNIKICQYSEWSDPLFAEVEDRARHQDAVCLECEK